MFPGLQLSWALVAVSLFNTILLLWLGLTLWLNADERDLGIILASGGFVLASLFFISHSALLLSEELMFSRSNELWLAIGLIPVVVLPYLWYVVLFWFADYWYDTKNRLYWRRRYLLIIATGIQAFALICLIVLGIPHIPPLAFMNPIILPVRDWIKLPIGGLPKVAVGYLFYLLLCVILSLDALRQPALSDRMMGEIARRRARPWLVVASLLLLLVGILVAIVVLWAITNTKEGNYYVFNTDDLLTIGRFDLAISLLIAAVTVLLGQAMTAYEVFTGKLLPRQGLARQWRRALFLATGYGVLMGGALTLGLKPVYAVLLTALLMTLFFALLSWRSYRDWEQMMRQLRPFVASQRWYDALITTPADVENKTDPFYALCDTVLNASVAYLIPTGPTATFVHAQGYPAGQPIPTLGAALEHPADNKTLMSAVDPQINGGAIWAIQLWSERGLIGLFLLGPCKDNSLYTQEEMEIARSTGERLIDTAASVTLSQRLMQLQRQRMSTTQILDQRTRRVLHDEVLPLIHTATLSLAAGETTETAIQHLADAHQEVSDLLHELPTTTTPEIGRLGLIGALKRMVEVEFAQAFDAVEWRCENGIEQQAARLTQLAAETVYYATRELVRNAAKYARSDAQIDALHLMIAVQAGDKEFRLTIEDNGIGFKQEQAEGHGLALHGTMMAIAGGSMALESTPDRMTRAQLLMPLEA
ncbi:MAG: hypothetical protein GY759_20990 [Chloroflexi bacterium]|nr:hypothetical protein [Chloroflexota bacterium]